MTTGVPSVQTLLWPHNLEYLLSPSHEAAVPAVTRSLATLATANKAGHLNRAIVGVWIDPWLLILVSMDRSMVTYISVN